MEFFQTKVFIKKILLKFKHFIEDNQKKQLILSLMFNLNKVIGNIKFKINRFPY
jgi:hypothetical protein